MCGGEEGDINKRGTAHRCSATLLHMRKDVCGVISPATHAVVLSSPHAFVALVAISGHAHQIRLLSPYHQVLYLVQQAVGKLSGPGSAHGRVHLVGGGRGEVAEQSKERNEDRRGC